MADKATLYERDGLLYVRAEFADYGKPEKVIHYWPVRGTDGRQLRVDQYNRQYVGEELAWAQIGAGNYYVKNRPAMSPVNVRLLNDGQTQAAWTETEPIPEPKQRGKKCETRYKDGRWQRYKQREGWVSYF